MQAVVLRSNARSARVLAACGYRCEELAAVLSDGAGPARDFSIYSRLATDRLDPWTRGPTHAARRSRRVPPRLQVQHQLPPAARDTQIRIERFASRSASLST